MDEEVSIVESPRSTYIVRSRPAVLSCKALNAQRVRFKCNSKWLADDRHELQTGTDDSAQKSFQLVSVELTRQDIEGELADLGEYVCHCYAFGSQDDEGVRSDGAKVRLAYIRKHFYQTPVSDRVAEGQTIQLPCVPPDGDPKVDVFWHKNGQEIQSDNLDSNLILANDGSLIISAARLSDSANYTCEAKNLANRRITDPAELVVYVDGEWSPWSAQWQGNCAVDCALLNTQLNMNLGDEQAISRVLPSQRRTRTCNNPAPLNGGLQCVGPEEEFRPCPHGCRIDGVWSRWSPFSECNSSCQRIRTRQCTAPAPSNSGLHCQGRDSEAVNCTDGILPPHCQQPIPSNSHIRLNGGDTPSSTFNGGQIYVLASLFCFAFLLVVITMLIVALFCRKRKTKSKTSQQYFPSVNDVHAVLLQQQQQKAALFSEMGSRDVKMMCTPPPAPYMKLLGPSTNPMFANNYTLKSNKSYASGYSHQRKFTGSRAALIGNDHYSSSNSSSNSGSGATPIKYPFNPNQQQFMPCAEDYATLYDCVPDKHTLSSSPAHVYTCTEGLEDDERRDDVCCSLSEDDLRTHDQQSATIVAAQVDSDCSRIELRKCGTAVLMSDGTFQQTTMVFLAISDDLQDRPNLCPEETWLSSVVEFGKCENESDEVILRRPVVLSVEHYASIFPKENWIFVLYADFGNGWTAVNQLGDENINTPVYVQIERQRFHVMTDQFGRYCLAGRPKRINVAPTKRVRISAYSSLPIMHEDSLVTIRVYCVPDCVNAMENVRKQEAEQNGKLLSDSLEFLMQESGDLCLNLEETEREIEFSDDGYTSPDKIAGDGVRYVEIPESRHLWCSQNGLHCNLSMNIPRKSSIIRARLTASQRGSTSEKQALHIQFDPFKSLSADKFSTHSSCEKLVSLDFQLSSDVKRQLSQLLDPPMESNNDWRGLAEILGFKRYLQFFGMRPGCSPTSLILDLFEATTTGSDCAVLDLLQKLRIMGRQDAVQILERFLATPFDFR